MSIISNGLDLGMLSGITDEIVKSDGTLKIDLKASGKLTNPNLNGQIDLEEGLIQTKTIRNEIGIPKALIVMTGQKATLQTLELTTSNGSANFEGDLDIPSMTYNLSGTMDNLLIKPERISAALTGDLKVNGKGQEVDVS